MAEGLRTTQDDTKVCSLDGAAFLSRTIGRDRGILTTPGGIRIAVWGKAYNFSLQSSRPVNRPQKLPIAHPELCFRFALPERGGMHRGTLNSSVVDCEEILKL